MEVRDCVSVCVCACARVYIPQGTEELSRQAHSLQPQFMPASSSLTGRTEGIDQAAAQWEPPCHSRGISSQRHRSLMFC